MEDGRWRIKDEERRMEDGEKIFLIMIMHIMERFLRMAFSLSMGVTKMIFFVRFLLFILG